MRWFFRIMIMCGMSLTIVSMCSCTTNEQFVQAVDTAWSVIGPEYKAYLDADPSLSSDTKITRKRTADELSALIEEAKK